MSYLHFLLCLVSLYLLCLLCSSVFLSYFRKKRRHTRVHSDRVKAAAAASAKSKAERDKGKLKDDVKLKEDEKAKAAEVLGPPTDLPKPTVSDSGKHPSVRQMLGPPKSSPPSAGAMLGPPETSPPSSGEILGPPKASPLSSGGHMSVPEAATQAPVHTQAMATRGRSTSRAMPSIVRRSRAASRALDNITARSAFSTRKVDFVTILRLKYSAEVPAAVQRSRALSKSQVVNTNKVGGAGALAKRAPAGGMGITGKTIAARVPITAGTLGVCFPPSSFVCLTMCALQNIMN